MKKEGFDFVFKQNPELAKIGTEKDYSDYLKTIFPESRVQNIVYHQTTRNFEDFDINKSRTEGIYFSPFNRKSTIIRKNYTKPALLNVKNPFIISKKQNRKFERYIVNLSRLSKKVDLKNYDAVIGFSNSFYDKGQLDSEIIDMDSSKKNNVEFAVMNPSQIYILGTKIDEGKFKDYMKMKNQGNSSNNSLEKIISGIFGALFLAGLFFSSSDITGNAIGVSQNNMNFVGIGLMLLGFVGFFVYRKFRN